MLQTFFKALPEEDILIHIFLHKRRERKTEVQMLFCHDEFFKNKTCMNSSFCNQMASCTRFIDLLKIVRKLHSLTQSMKMKFESILNANLATSSTFYLFIL
jgi:hypothetical protein